MRRRIMAGLEHQITLLVQCNVLRKVLHMSACRCSTLVFRKSRVHLTVLCHALGNLVID